eukprot:Sspe_Gene.113896::Locus_98687_Transcript_1_1_Confidence_1.000_Length_1605::g.113896::m.113896/K03849/ALG8; alpha-1,3-glucosyltransferase
MLDLHNLDYSSPATVTFQRLSVIVADVLLYAAVAIYLSGDKLSRGDYWWRLGLVVLYPGLLMVDNIHFQYNGFLYGLWVLSLIAADKGRYVLCGGIFAVVLCFKHIYMYMAPAYFFFLLHRYCLTSPTVLGKVGRTVQLGAVVVAVFAVCFGPFAVAGLLPAVLRRMFPWGRGLCHAYWAPNLYAVYNILDMVMARLLGRSGETSVNTRGLVDQHEPGMPTHAVLPSVTPAAAMALTVLLALVLVSRPLRANPRGELGTLCALSSIAFFAASWHVHEKAILMVVLPLAICTPPRLHRNIAVVGALTLFPLLPDAPAKILLTACYSVVVRADLLVVLPTALCAAVHALGAYPSRYPFLPLLAVSVVGGVSLIYLTADLLKELRGTPRFATLAVVALGYAVCCGVAVLAPSSV